MNINVTLLFKVGQYERVMEAFIRAMERRLEAGRPLDRHSVASFFVSRVDTEVDKRLEALGNTRAAGPRRPGERARRLPGVPARLRGRALRGAARGGLPGAAPAVGVDRREEPDLPADALRLGARRARHREHDAAADAARPPAAGRAHRRDRGRGPVAPTSRRWPPPGSTSRTSPTSCCARASTRSWCRCRSCSTGSRPSGRRSRRRGVRLQDRQRRRRRGRTTPAPTSRASSGA